MFEANAPIGFLMLASFFVAETFLPNLPKKVRLGFGAFMVVFGTMSWWWPILLPIDNDLGSLLTIGSTLLLLGASFLLIFKGSARREPAAGR